MAAAYHLPSGCVGFDLRAGTRHRLAPDAKWGLALPPAPTFLGFHIFSREGRSFFRLGGSEPSSRLATAMASDRVPASALLPRNFPFAVPSPEARVPPDGLESGSGIGLRLCLTLLPRSPCHSLLLQTDILANVCRFGRWQRPRALSVAGRSLLATG